MSLHHSITMRLREAMKARDTASVSLLRTLLGALDNASAVPQTAEHQSSVGKSGDVARRELSPDDERSILAREIEERERAAEHYEQAGRLPDAEKLRAEIQMIETLGGGARQR